MLSISRQNRPLSPARWAARIFTGEIILSPAAGAALARQARRITRYFFAPHEPPVAHRFFARGEFFRRAAAAQKRFETDPAVAAAFASLAAANGWPSRGLARDRLILRIAPPVAEHAGGAMSHTLPHRDLWGVAIPQQINWWMPIWPVAKNRTLGFWPDFFTRPLANDTATWSFAKLLAARKGLPQGEAGDYPAAPRALEAPPSPPAPAVFAPGRALLFSCAHLHASIPNTSALTRFSFETRTVWADDIRRNRAAPNVDCATPRPAYRLFAPVVPVAPVAGGDNPLREFF